CCVNVSCCFFFFQAEDGIRDGHVTGVQTCALPISVSAVFNHGLKFGLIPRGPSGEIGKYNPMKLVSAPCKSDFESVELSGAEAEIGRASCRKEWRLVWM